MVDLQKKRLTEISLSEVYSSRNDFIWSAFQILRNLFKGYDTLNQIQSVVYHAAYETSENMLVCAPTGAGKTNTAMLAIAREIRHHMASDGSLDKNFTIIYVAPMKALASEMVRTFTDRLKFYKLRVEEVTGDTQVAMFDLEKTQVIYAVCGKSG